MRYVSDTIRGDGRKGLPCNLQPLLPTYPMKTLLSTLTIDFDSASGSRVVNKKKESSFDTWCSCSEYIASQLGLLHYHKGYFVECVEFESFSDTTSIIRKARAVKRLPDGSKFTREFEVF